MEYMSDKSHFLRVSLRFLNLPSEETVFCSLSIRALVWTKQQMHF